MQDQILGGVDAHRLVPPVAWPRHGAQPRQRGLYSTFACNAAEGDARAVAAFVAVAGAKAVPLMPDTGEASLKACHAPDPAVDGAARARASRYLLKPMSTGCSPKQVSTITPIVSRRPVISWIR